MSDNTGATNAVGLTFFFVDAADTIEALAARIIPSTAENPGAREAGVATYIDRALSGPYFRWQGVHREGVRTINGYTIQRYGKKFFEFSETDQDAVVGALEKGEIPGFGDSHGGVFPTYNGYNPTDTIQAITHWVAEHIKRETQNGGTLTRFTTRQQAVG